MSPRDPSRDDAARPPDRTDPADPARLAALRERALLDTAPDLRFDRIVALVRTLCRTPIALVSLVDRDRQWFKAKSGTGLLETDIDTSVCALAIRQRGLFQIEDLAADPRTAGMSLVTGPAGLRFYAGAPLVTPDGHALGSLCAIDTVPRPGGLDAGQAEALTLLADQVMELIEAHEAIVLRDRAKALDDATVRMRAAEDRYRTIVDSAIDSAIVALDPAGRVTAWSEGAQRLYGWTQEEMLGESIERISLPEHRAAGLLDAKIALALSEGRAADERWHLRKDGSRFYAHGAMTPLRGSDQTGFVKAVRDITGEYMMRAELEQARAAAEMMTRAARLGTFDFDPATATLIWDQGCRTLFGLASDRPVTYEDAFLPGIHPDDRAGADAAVAAALDPDGDGLFETEYRTIGLDDGVLRYVAARGQAFFDAERPLRMLGTVHDVTEARLGEARLRETEQRLRLANRATNDVIWDWNLVEDQITWNEAIERAYGHALSRIDPGSRWWLDHVHPEDRARVDTGIHAVIDGDGTDWTDDYRFRRADGSYADILDRGYVIRDADGRPIRMIGAMLDQSERISVERRLRHQATDLAEQVQASAAEIERLWNASPDLLLVTDGDGRFHRLNPAWRGILGHDPDDLVGMISAALIHPDDAEGSAEALEVAQTLPIANFQNRLRHADGGWRWISWVAAPSGGEIFAIGRDVTAAREAEAALRQAEEALRQAQKVEAVGQLTGSVAHDFNNLLTVIRGSVDLLRRPGMSEERRNRYIEAIADTADRATRLTGQLLAFARRQTLRPETFDAAAAVSALGEMLGTLAGPRIEICCDLPDGATCVSADPSQFDTAIVNMAVNARDAMAGEGMLTIAVRAVDRLPPIGPNAAVEGHYVAVSITDTGIGIASDQLDRIFEPFFTTKGVGHGTGLGLSQVFGFAKQSAGEVAVRSEPGRGTTFTLYLPRVESEAPAVAGTGAARTADAPRARILVVEDNDEVGAFATQALAELGHVTRWARDADAAIALLAEDAGGYDLVFTDVVMPGRSGVDLAEDVRRLHPELPVLLTSGYSYVLAQEGTRGFELLRKPYSLDELAAALDRMLRRQVDAAAG